MVFTDLIFRAKTGKKHVESGSRMTSPTAN